VVIADAQAIADHVERAYGRTCEVIPYGADVIDPGSDRLVEVGMVRRDFHLIVARMEPENHVLDAVHAYRVSDETRPLLVVGSAPYSQWYIDKVHEAAAEDPRIRFLGGVYDQELLDQLYAHCRTYVHGHSVGAGAPVLAFDCEFNREVTDGQAFFWSDANQLTELFDAVAADDVDTELNDFSAAGQARVLAAYQWDAVTDAYVAVIGQLLSMKHRRSSSGIRNKVVT